MRGLSPMRGLTHHLGLGLLAMPQPDLPVMPQLGLLAMTQC